MSFLLFMDESGHDHKAMPYEVRGGLAVHASRVWPLTLVYLFERYCYFLDEQNETGLLVMDQVEKSLDRKFGQRIANYFERTGPGRDRSKRLVPVPLFVTSDMNYLIQMADLCLYAMNWGLRLSDRGMDAPTRKEIETGYSPLLRKLQWQGRGRRGDKQFASYSIGFVPEPF